MLCSTMPVTRRFVCSFSGVSTANAVQAPATGDDESDEVEELRRPVVRAVARQPGARAATMFTNLHGAV